MTDIIIAASVVAVTGLICGLILALASKFMNIAQDERISDIRECLPGANCGACGFTGCDGYAKAIIEIEGTPTNLCTPGGAETARKIAEKLGVEFSEVEKKVAFVKCHGDCSATTIKFNYEGINTCTAAKMHFSGHWACPHGCLGFGDCALVCSENAISIKDGVAHVDPSRCIGCGLCAKTCPNALISIFPMTKQTIVSCSNTDKGVIARAVCSNACIGCKKCEKTCAEGAIKVENNLAKIDGEKCTSCGSCVQACPVGCIKIADFAAVSSIQI